ncbi:radical SAM protein [candidate division KSB1 bacterium]|nr:radical SAM protein [candidate division KSB1 bacterium]
MSQTKPAKLTEILKSLAANYQIIKVKPSLIFFLLQYMKKFKVLNVGGNLVLHSHLPPLNSKAYSRFVNEHLLQKISGPSHAQIGLTNACPQNCQYCYNKNRHGKILDTETIIRLIRELKKMGVLWIGFTGGEPLLQKDIVKITESAGDDVALKLFTTGCTLTPQLAADLKNAGLKYVSVSLDHWQAEEHDQGRRYPGAFRTALKAIEIFKETGGLHVGVSAVLSREMIRNGEVEIFLGFLAGLEIHEAWLSEAKPSIDVYWNEDKVISEEDRIRLVQLQDRYNKTANMTINYLGHFEGSEHFGCNAGHKMVYIDAFGEVSPCVFTPMTFGNVNEKSIETIFSEMKALFPSEGCCFMNKNYKLFQKYNRGNTILRREESISLMNEVQFGPLAKFFQLFYH